MKKEKVAKVIGIYSICLGSITGITIVGLFFLYFGIQINYNLKKNIHCKNEIKMLIIFYIIFFFFGLGLIAILTVAKYPLVLAISAPLFLLAFGTPFVFAVIYLIKDNKNPTVAGDLNIYCEDKVSELKRLYEARLITKEVWDLKREDLLEENSN